MVKRYIFLILAKIVPSNGKLMLVEYTIVNLFNPQGDVKLDQDVQSFVTKEKKE